MVGESILEGGGDGEVQLVVFQLGAEEFGVDISQVREIIKPTEITKMPNSPEFVEGVINLRGQITTIMDLRKRLDMEVVDSDQTRIIIVDISDEIIGMVVDSVTEVRRLPQSDIEPTPSISTAVDTEYIMGVGKLKTDGQDRLLILLDLRRVLSEKELGEMKEATMAKASV